MVPERKKYQLLSFWGHVIFWIFSIGFILFQFYVVAGSESLFSFETLVKALIVNMGFAFVVYTNIYLLIPKFLKQKNYIFYVFWLIILLSAISLLIQFIFMYPLRFMLAANKFEGLNSNIYPSFFFASVIYVGITSLLKFIKDWLLLQDLNYKYAQIERQKLEAELKTLKGQINPHFLFNSLNNIYSLALTRSEKVPELILKLSDLMRHIIYDSRENYINLDKELEFVNNFIALQKIRVNEKASIDFEIIGEVPNKKIAPLLFEPFIDNAFKHSLRNTSSELCVEIIFDFTSKDKLVFKIENCFDEPAICENKYKGIGLDNVKQRLQYLYNVDEYQLEISKKENKFIVVLELKLID